MESVFLGEWFTIVSFGAFDDCAKRAFQLIRITPIVILETSPNMKFLNRTLSLESKTSGFVILYRIKCLEVIIFMPIGNQKYNVQCTCISTVQIYSTWCRLQSTYQWILRKKTFTIRNANIVYIFVDGS